MAYICSNHIIILGATPDNTLKCDCCPKSSVEYKCPHKIRNESIAESQQKCDFLKIVNDRIQLKRSHKYYAQITGQMVITEHHCTYFVVFTTKDIVVEYIGFDKDCWKKKWYQISQHFSRHTYNHICQVSHKFSFARYVMTHA